MTIGATAIPALERDLSKTQLKGASMTGTITQVLGLKRTYAIITSEDHKEIFLHVRDLDRSVPMQPGIALKFELCLVPGKTRPEARNAVAA